MQIPNQAFHEIERLQESNLNLQAYEKAKPYGSLQEWEGTERLLVASHLAYSLGAPELSERITSRAWHRDKTDPMAVFYQAGRILEKRGPLPALLFMRKFSNFSADEKLMSWWYSLYCQIHSALRDFAVADEWHARAVDALPTESWVWVSRSFALEQQDRYEDALASAQKAFELAPHRRVTVSTTAYYLTLLERSHEAMDLLANAIQTTENAWLIKQLADLQTEAGKYDEAYTTLKRGLDLLPLIELKVAQWFYGGLSDLAYLVGEQHNAIDYAQKADNPFHKKVLENMKNAPADAKRTVLDVGFLRQHHMTCAPATLSNIARFWKKPADHLDLVEKMCYDGTPSYKERIWAESQNWVTKELTLNWPDATLLLDHGVPLTLATVYPGGGHLQAIIGYDGRRRTFLVRDPYHQRTGEFLADELIENQKASGPRVMALVPANSAELFEQIDHELFESAIYDLVYKVDSALEVHDRDKAGEALEKLEEVYPGHRLTLVARWGVSHYDTNMLGVRSALSELLRQFPDDVNLRLNELRISYDSTSRTERLEQLEKYSKAKPTDPLIWQMFGYELGIHAKQRRRALHWLMRSLRTGSGDGFSFRFIADVLWAQRRFEEATELYRIAVSLNDKDEQFAYSYFLAMRYLRRDAEALDFLADRFERFGKRSGQPACSYYAALREIGRVEDGFKILERAMQLRPDDGDLLLYSADAMAHYGRNLEADELLRKAERAASRPRWLRTAALVAQLKGDLASALSAWREVLEEDPSAFDAHRNIAFLLKGLEGSAAAKDHLRRVCRKFPRNRSLLGLRLEHLDEEPGEAIAVLRDLLLLDSGDIWAWRELAKWYSLVGKLDRSLEAAEKALEVDPNDAVSHWFRGRTLESLTRYQEAAEEYRASVRLHVDYTIATASLVELSRTIEAKREVLRFVRAELDQQPSNGDAVFAYRENARRVIDNPTLLKTLQDYHSANKRSWFAASAIIQQLVDMGRHDEAEKLAIESTERFPLNSQTWLDLAAVYRPVGNINGEIDALRRAVSLNPVWSPGVQQLAEACIRAGRFGEARDFLLEGLTRMPFDNFLLGFLADAYWNLGDRAAAIATAKRAVLIEPDYTWAWGAIKRWAAEAGDPDLPASLARDLTEKRPKDIRAWINLADMLDSGTYSEERRLAVEEALRIDPHSSNALAIKANLLADGRKFDEAVAVAQTKMADGHRPEQLRFVESGIESMRGNNRRALDILIELTESSPGYVPGWFRLADFYRLDPERKHEYRKVAIEMTRLVPREAASFGYLAEACLNLDLQKEAREALQQAVILDPTHEYAVSTLFKLLLDANDLAEAERLVETVVASSKVSGLPISVELAVRRNDHGATYESLRELLLNKEIGRETLDYVLEKAVSFLGKTDTKLGQLLDEVCASSDANPIAGRYLIDFAWATSKVRGAETALKSVAHLPSTWAHAASGYMDILSSEKPTALLKFIDRHADKLAVETESWGAVGYQLTKMDDLPRTEKWFANWTGRTDLMPWMLWNYSVMLRRGSHSEEADRVNAAALEVPYDNTVNLHLTTLALSECSRGNFPQAAAIFAGINPGTMSEWDRFFYDTLNEAIWAYQAIEESKVDDAKALIDSLVDKILAFDLQNSDRMVNDLGRKTVSALLRSLGDKWFSFRKKFKLFYYSFRGL
ncbi:MAG TPA: tetratricopeptide repeat protein [Pyrinomonadaceae bacterium]|nr:tetratricopeptide repeat protein [Pyrinomonadaceae bacterium]